MNKMKVLVGEKPDWMEHWICAANGERRRWTVFEYLALKKVAEARNHHHRWQDPMQKMGRRGRPRAAEWMADDESQGRRRSVPLQGRVVLVLHLHDHETLSRAFSYNLKDLRK